MKTLIIISILLFSMVGYSQQVTDTYDVSDLPSDSLRDGIRISKDMVGWSLTFKTESLTGTLDGEISLYYSPNGTDTVLVVSSGLPLTLDEAAANLSVEKSTLNYQYLHYKITKNGLTGGTITAYLNTKQY